MSVTKKIFIGLVLLLFVVIQFFRIDKTNPPVEPDLDIVNVVKAPVVVSEMLKTSCYDCHSNESIYPWYTNIAPVSWWIKKHINEGRDELNFSEWGNYSARRKDHKLDEIIELVEEGEMPLKSYLITHGDAKISTEQRAKIVEWAEMVREDLGYVPEKK